MNVIIAFLNFLILGTLSFWLSRKQHELKPVFWPALCLKLTAGIAVGLIYTFYYTIGDTFVYFEDSRVIAALAKSDFSAYIKFLWNSQHDVAHKLHLVDARSLYLTKIASVLSLVTGSNYWLISIWFSFISFLCAWQVVRTISFYFPVLKYPALISFCFFPSVTFWSAGLLKESLALAALYYLTALFINIWFDRRPDFLEFILMLISLWVVWNLKYYFAAIYFPIMFGGLLYKLLLSKLFKPQTPLAQLGLWMVALLLPLLTISLLHPNFYPEKLLNVVVNNYEVYHQVSEPTDVITYSNLQPNVTSVLINTPWALVSGLFRPFVWEANTFFQSMTGLENLCVLALTLLALPNLKILRSSQHHLLIMSVLLYVMALCVFITLSTPNFGTLTRYRVGYMPFLGLIILYNNPLILFLQRWWNRLVRQ